MDHGGLPADQWALGMDHLGHGHCIAQTGFGFFPFFFFFFLVVVAGIWD